MLPGGALMVTEARRSRRRGCEQSGVMVPEGFTPWALLPSPPIRGEGGSLSLAEATHLSKLPEGLHGHRIVGVVRTFGVEDLLGSFLDGRRNFVKTDGKGFRRSTRLHVQRI